MIRKIFIRGFAIAVLACTMLVLAVVASWAWRGGPEGAFAAAARTLRHPTPTVYDVRHQPSRPLAASATPLRFGSSRPDVAPPPMVEGGEGRRMPLQQLIATTGTLAFVVIHDDSIVYERYATEHGGAGTSHYQEISEAILAVLVGMAVDDGVLRALDDPVTAYVPELASRGFSQLTLRQLLDMNADLDDADGDSPFGLHLLMNNTTQLEALVLKFGLREGHGGRFEHRSGESALLSLALQRALAPESLTAYAQRRLWSPLGMEQPGLWSLDRDGGMEKAWCCIAGTARDLAKIGRLQLQRGLAGGRRVLSQAWVNASAPKPAASAAAGRTYHFGWWPASPSGVDAMAVGRDGQFLYIDPAHNTVVVRLGKRLGPLSQAQWSAVFGTLSAHAW